MKVSDINRLIDGELVNLVKDTDIVDLASTSQSVVPGSLFFAVVGSRVDGHDYVDEAIRNGASCIVVEHAGFARPGVSVIKVPCTKIAMSKLAAPFFDFPSSKMQLIGITGTNGKTTTSTLIYNVLSQMGMKVGLIGTAGHKIGEESIPSANTTPDSITLQKLLNKMVDASITHVVMEVSSHGLKLGRTEGCQFSSVGFTNLSQDHLDFHLDFADYKNSKKMLFSSVSNQTTVVLNVDDSTFEEYAQSTSGVTFGYGIHNDGCEIFASDISLSSNGMEFIIHTPVGSELLRTSLIGMFNVYNIMLCTSLLLAQNFNLSKIARAIEKIEGILGRMQPINGGQSYSVLVDYAHTPDALKNVLTTIREYAKGKIITVVGCGGDRDKTKRPLMGRQAESLSDVLIITSDNPRSESVLSIIQDMEGGLVDKNHIVEFDRARAIDLAISMANENDVVLIAGKGHETYQIINNRTMHFDDSEYALQSITSHLK